MLFDKTGYACQEHVSAVKSLASHIHTQCNLISDVKQFPLGSAPFANADRLPKSLAYVIQYGFHENYVL